MICARLLPQVRRVRSCTRLRNRASDCDAMRRRGCVPPVKLKPRNLRSLGRATALFALLTLSLRRLARKLSGALKLLEHGPFAGVELGYFGPLVGYAHRHRFVGGD